MPPEIAPVQAVIVPIILKDKADVVLKKARELKESLKKSGFSVELDEREITPGTKFFDWEIKGVPVRIEVGPRDVDNKQVVFVRRDTGEKLFVKENEIESKLKSTFSLIQENLLANATKKLKSGFADADSLDKMKSVVNAGKIASVYWCEGEKCHTKIVTLEDGFEGFGSDLEKHKESKCVVCGKNTATLLFVARSY